MTKLRRGGPGHYSVQMGLLDAAEWRWGQLERRIQHETNRMMRPKPWKLWTVLALSSGLVAMCWLSATHLWSLTEPSPRFMEVILSVLMPEKALHSLMAGVSLVGIRTSTPGELHLGLAKKLSSFLVPPPLVRSICVWGGWSAYILSSAAMVVAVVSWHVLALAAVLVLSIVGTACETVLAVGWAEYMTASFLVFRTWALVLLLAGSMYFAFGSLTPRRSPKTHPRLAGGRPHPVTARHRAHRPAGNARHVAECQPRRHPRHDATRPGTGGRRPSSRNPHRRRRPRPAEEAVVRTVGHGMAEAALRPGTPTARCRTGTLTHGDR